MMRQRILVEKLIPMFEKEPESVVDQKALRMWRMIGPFGSDQGGVKELVDKGILTL